MEKNLVYILKLLTDPDKKISQIAKEELKKIDNIEAKLHNFISISKSFGISKNEIRKILQEIVFDKALEFFKNWQIHSEDNLLDPLFWISKIVYPTLKQEDIKSQLQNCIDYIEIDPENLNPREKIAVVNSILYDKIKLQSIFGLRDINDYMINKVLETGYAGMSYTAAMYILISNMKGFNLTLFKGAENYVIADVNYAYNYLNSAPKINFFINPYHKGTISEYKSFMEMLKDEGIEHKTFFKIVSNLDLIKRIISDIKTILQNRENTLYVYFKQLFELLI